jgi:hypothetical protein
MIEIEDPQVLSKLMPFIALEENIFQFIFAVRVSGLVRP